MRGGRVRQRDFWPTSELCVIRPELPPHPGRISNFLSIHPPLLEPAQVLREGWNTVDSNNRVHAGHPTGMQFETLDWVV
jgi:hypothetical protein